MSKTWPAPEPRNSRRARDARGEGGGTAAAARPKAPTGKGSKADPKGDGKGKTPKGEGGRPAVASDNGEGMARAGGCDTPLIA